MMKTMKILVTTFGLLVMVGCASVPVQTMIRAENPASKEPTEPTQRCEPVLTLAPDPREGVVRVTIDSPGPCPGGWRFPALAQTIEINENRGTTWQVRYDVRPDATHGDCPFEVNPDRAVFCGKAVVPLPEGDELPKKLLLKLLTDEVFHKRSSSSFGMTVPPAEISFEDIEKAAFLFGDIGMAQFQVPEGRDHAAWVGYFSFDPRWIAAETAGIRTSVDQWFRLKRTENDPSVGLLLLSKSTSNPEVVVRQVLRGWLVEADVRAGWSSRTRLDITRKIVQRVIGPVLTLHDVDGMGQNVWFEEGIAHVVGMNVLMEMGILSSEEVAEEVSSWLGEDRLNAFSGLSLPELAETFQHSTEARRQDAGRLLAVRGALLGLALGPGLKTVLVGALGQGRQEISREELLAANQAGRSLEKQFLGGEPIPISPESLGSCFRQERRRLFLFELGFSPQESEVPFRIHDVKPDGEAAKAGLRKDDTVLSIDFGQKRASSLVRMTVQREEGRQDIEFYPRGAFRWGKALVVGRGCGLE